MIQTNLPMRLPRASASKLQPGKPAPPCDLTYSAKEYKVVTLREIPMETPPCCDQPQSARDYWHATINTHPFFDPEKECMVALLLNTRRRVKGHVFLASGTLDTILIRAGDVFRPACVAAASAIVLMHNHPSGDPTPSEADIKVTRDLIRAGQMLKIEVLDHIVIGRACAERSKDFQSLRELGYCA